jgi:tRNA pseudouridine13 synthase
VKIKVKPEDFIVREKTLLAIGDAPAAYRIYRLGKRQWDSFDLIDVLSRRFRILKSDIAVGGHKDRYGDSEQLVSIKNQAGLPEKLEEENFYIVSQGYAEHALKAAHIAGNWFRIVLRDLSQAETEVLKKNCLAVRTWGFPNYYDEQRFGSARAGKGFLGKALFLGKMEEALKIYLAPSESDQSEIKAYKIKAASLWRQWGKIDLPVPRRYARVFAVLNTPGGYMAFNKAVNAIDRDLVILSLHAYQSFLFNQLLAGYLLSLDASGEAGPLERFDFRYGDLAFYRTLSDSLFEKLKALILPVPGHDTIVEDPVIRNVLDTVLADEKINLSHLKVKKLHGKAVRGTERKAIVIPEQFAFDGPENDDVFSGRKKMTLDFYLPRGSYATMLIKRISLGLSF